ncbi:patatin-like phospholipase family protein [Streptomyces sp. NBC_00503]|uniref:patatin-like phospholipase family protein n=1 Tax=Streptomyces sp. NBC_00503 TaxID=2903659 RepID=UPI002E817AF9|nr:patatin-like phospholipase family protein [Streptomyces sp. NBC_00503]WUD85270.1 patatin-like phospholipase family protein [Streptomyces sp. NBC_00503]
MADTALVLGGGGTIGLAWTVGMMAGLAEAGIDLSCADVTIGTSAGSVLGARLASGLSAEELYAEQLDGAPKIDAEITLGQTARFLWAALGSRDPQRSVQRLGRAALAADTVPESAVHEAIAVLLGGVRDWPGSDLRLTGVDARTGALEVFDATSGVTLPEAVAASCAVPVLWPPVSVAGRRWMDGGSRSTANVHLARGHRRVVAIAPIPKAVGPHPSATEQGAELAEDGTLVAVLTPDRASRKAFGRNMLDQTRCAAAARAGRTQAAECVDTVRAVWNARAEDRPVRQAAHGGRTAR